MLDDKNYRALQEQAHLLSELEAQPGWQELKALAHDHMNPLKKRLLNGNLTDHEQYQRVVGELIGTHFVLDIPQGVREALDEEMRQRAEAGEPLT